LYYFEKDYIMRLIHGIAQILAKLLFNRLDFPKRPRTELILNTRVVAEYL